MSHKHLTISSDLGQLKTVRAAVLELATPCLANQAHMVVLAVDEAVSNVMRHGYRLDAGKTSSRSGAAQGSGSARLTPTPFDENQGTRLLPMLAVVAGSTSDAVASILSVDSGAIDVDIQAECGRLEICIADNGPAYNPCEARTEDLADRVLQRQRGGMGISIIRRVMDEVHYTRPEGCRNELRLIKYFGPKT